MTRLSNFILIFVIIIGNWFAAADAVTTLSDSDIEKLLTNVDISGQRYKAVRKGTFDNYADLVSLNLTHRRIIKLNKQAFAGLRSLKELHLNGNFISNTTRAFVDLKNLRLLDISDNKLSPKMCNKFFVGITQRTRIIMKNVGGIEKICGSDFDGKSYTVSQDNSKTKISSAKSRSKSNGKKKTLLKHSTSSLNETKFEYQICRDADKELEYLGQKYNDGLLRGIECRNVKLNEGILKLGISANPGWRAVQWYQLKENQPASKAVFGLNFDKWAISELQYNFVSLLPRHFKTLRIGFSKITHLKEGVWDHPGIYELVLTNNYLSKIDDDAIGMPNLGILDLRKTYMSNMSFVTTLPIKIWKLDLSNSFFNTIKVNTFSRLKNLQILLLQRNEIATIEPGAFEGLSKLAQLYLFDNKLSSIEKGVFTGLENLKELRLRHNQFVKIHNEMFVLPALQMLHLHHNNITTIEKQVFKHSKQLCLVNLSYNPITKLPSDLFFGLPKTSECYVNVTNSPLEVIEPVA